MPWVRIKIYNYTTYWFQIHFTELHATPQLHYIRMYIFLHACLYACKYFHMTALDVRWNKMITIRTYTQGKIICSRFTSDLFTILSLISHFFISVISFNYLFVILIIFNPIIRRQCLTTASYIHIGNSDRKTLCLNEKQTRTRRREREEREYNWIVFSTVHLFITT